ncbi:MAG: hypothetical protein Q8S22_02875 [Eubacteriales bacterium]|nr:hypothetical protein [Eubacteriales bacterium]
MYRDKLVKIILLTLLFPFVIYILGSCIIGYIPPTESYKKTPKQFEELFNEQMAKYGMSIDIDSVAFVHDDDNLRKVVPIVCEDGSKLSCIYYPTGKGSKSLIVYLKFEQELSGTANETIYIEPLLAFVMDEFVPGMTQNKDESFEPITSETYNGALDACRVFIEGEESKKSMYISPKNDKEIAVTFKRETDEKTILSVRFHLWNE